MRSSISGRGRKATSLALATGTEPSSPIAHRGKEEFRGRGSRMVNAITLIAHVVNLPGIIISQGRHTLCIFSHFEMLRFLKKRWKPSPKPVPPENPTHQTAGIDAERDGDSEGEHRLRGLMKLMGPIRPSHQISTVKEAPESQIRMEGLRTSGSPC